MVQFWCRKGMVGAHGTNGWGNRFGSPVVVLHRGVQWPLGPQLRDGESASDSRGRGTELSAALEDGDAGATKGGQYGGYGWLKWLIEFNRYE